MALFFTSINKSSYNNMTGHPENLVGQQTATFYDTSLLVFYLRNYEEDNREVLEVQVEFFQVPDELLKTFSFALNLCSYRYNQMVPEPSFNIILSYCCRPHGSHQLLWGFAIITPPFAVDLKYPIISAFTARIVVCSFCVITALPFGQTQP